MNSLFYLLSALLAFTCDNCQSACAQINKEHEKKSTAMAAAKNSAASAGASKRDRDTILNILPFPPELQQIIKEYSYDYSTLDLFPFFYQSLLPFLSGHNGQVTSVAISPDSKTLVYGSCSGRVNDDGSYGGCITMWDIDSQSTRATVNIATSSVAISPDSKTLVSGSFNGAIKIHDSDFPLRVTPLPDYHIHPATSLAISPDGKTIISGSRDSTKIWDIDSRSCIATLPDIKSTSLAISPDDKTIVSASNILVGQTYFQGRMITRGSLNCTIKIWDIASRSCTATLSEHAKQSPSTASSGIEEEIRSVAISPDGKTIVSCSLGSIKIWDVDSRSCVATLPDNGASVAISPDGKNIISGSAHGTTRIWNIASRSCIAVLPDHRDYVTLVAISSDSKTIVSASNNLPASSNRITIYQYNPQLFAGILDLSYEQLYCLRLILKIVNKQETGISSEHIEYYQALVTKTWDALSPAIKLNIMQHAQRFNSYQQPGSAAPAC